MTYQKLTDNGTECNNCVYFAFDAEIFNTSLITDALEIEPTAVRIKKDPAPKSTSWKYQIKVGPEIDLENPLEKLLEVFESKIETINELKHKYQLKTRLQFVIYIDINPGSSTPFFGLNNRAIDFLASTETEVDFDLYKAEYTGLLNKLSSE